MNGSSENVGPLNSSHNDLYTIVASTIPLGIS